MKTTAKKLLSLFLVFAMMLSMFVVQASAAAAPTVTVKVTDSANESVVLSTWTYDSENKTYIDGNNGEELAIVTDYSSDPLVYTGINKKPDPRCLAVTTKGIALEDLYDYATDLMGTTFTGDLRGDTKMKVAAGSYGDEFTYDQYWGLPRYNYMSWYNAASYTDAQADTFADGVEVPATLAIVGYHATTGKNIADLVSSADDANALRISVGMQENGNRSIEGVSGDDLNEGSLSVKNIDAITFTLTKTFDEVGIHVHNYSDNGFCTCNAYNPAAENYVVSTADQLVAIADGVNNSDAMTGKNITLANDIDLSSLVWAPIGDAANAFAGTFDGAGHSISGLNVNTDAGHAGLFGYNKGTIKNFAISGTVASTTSADYVGGVAGYNSGMISGVSSSVNVTADKAYNVGGIAGFNDGGYNANISTSASTGGNGNIANCVVMGDVTGQAKVGGIVGENAGSVSSCAATGKVDGTNATSKNGVGGIVGRNGNNNTALEEGTVASCYFTGTVGRAGQKWVGGIAGFNNAKSGITNCYMAGTLVAGMGYCNVICGNQEGAKNTSNNYALEGYSKSGSTEAEIGIVKTAEEMKSAAFVAALGDAFQANICGYPVLTWQQPVDHSVVVDEAVAPTCTEAGLTEGSHCSVCNEVLVEQETVNALNHDLTHHDYVAPGCKSNGNVEYWSCSNCKMNFSGASATTTIDDVTIRGTGHKWAEATYTWSETDDGYTCTGSTYCANEGCTNYPQSNPMTEEGTVTYDVVTPVGCESDGLGRYTATFTNNKIATTSKDVVIPATGHTVVTDKAVAATCTATGKTAGTSCSVCKTVISGCKDVPVKEHTVVADKAVAATYAKTGKTAGSHCDICGAVLTAQKTVAMKKLAQAKITSITNTSTGITVKWGKVTGATAYQVYRKVGTGSWKLIKTTTSTSLSNSSLTNGTKYQYKVRAVVKNSAGKVVNTGAFSTVKTMYRLTRPTLASGTKNIATRKIVVKWNKNTKATGYQVKYIKGTTTKTVTVKGASSLTKTLSSLTKGSTYKVYVRSYKTVSGTNYYSAWSAYKSVKVVK